MENFGYFSFWIITKRLKLYKLFAETLLPVFAERKESLFSQAINLAI